MLVHRSPDIRIARFLVVFTSVIEDKSRKFKYKYIILEICN